MVTAGIDNQIGYGIIALVEAAPDGSKYEDNSDDAVKPQKINNVVISKQHADTLKDMHTKEWAGYNGSEMITQGMEEMNKLIGTTLQPHGGIQILLKALTGKTFTST